MSETAILADHIDQQVEEILAVWKSTVDRLGNVPDADRLSYREFVDHIPELLIRLADRLRGGDGNAGETGQKHGQHRWSQGYDIAEVVTELGHLRATLLRDTFAFARQQGFSFGRVESMITAIDDILDEATAESVGQFQADSQALNRSMLDTFEERRLVAESEKIKLQTVLDNLPVGVWVCDGFGNIIGANREAERLQGFPETEVVGRLNVAEVDQVYRHFRPDGKIYTPDDFPLARALHGETILQEEIIWPVGEKTIQVTANAAPLAGTDGTINGAVVVIQDVSDRKRLEEELAISEAQFRGIVAKSPVMIWRADVVRPLATSSTRPGSNSGAGPWTKSTGRDGPREFTPTTSTAACCSIVSHSTAASRSSWSTVCSMPMAAIATSPTEAPRIAMAEVSFSAFSARASTSRLGSSSWPSFSSSRSTRAG